MLRAKRISGRGWIGGAHRFWESTRATWWKGSLLLLATLSLASPAMPALSEAGSPAETASLEPLGQMREGLPLRVLMLMSNMYGANYFMVCDAMELLGWDLTTVGVAPTVYPCATRPRMLPCSRAT